MADWPAVHDFGEGTDTPTVVRKELKIEPEEFDKQFIASVEAETKYVVEHLDEYLRATEDLGVPNAPAPAPTPFRPMKQFAFLPPKS